MNSLIYTSHGLLYLFEIEQNSNNNIKTDENKSIENVIIRNSDVKKITTLNGIQFDLYSDQNIQVTNSIFEKSWKLANNLRIGDMLYVKLGNTSDNLTTLLPVIESGLDIIQPNILTKDLAWFLGFFLMNGRIYDEGIHIEHGIYKDKIKDLFFSNFGLYVTQNYTITDSKSKSFKDWLRLHECLKIQAYQIVPKIIRTAPKEQIKSFLEGFLSRDEPFIYSFNLCQQLLQLCRFVGYDAMIQTLSTYKWTLVLKSYNMDITETYDVVLSLDNKNNTNITYLQIEEDNYYNISGFILK
jgi:hypothetical protein